MVKEAEKDKDITDDERKTGEKRIYARARTPCVRALHITMIG